LGLNSNNSYPALQAFNSWEYCNNNKQIPRDCVFQAFNKLSVQETSSALAVGKRVDQPLDELKAESRKHLTQGTLLKQS
jgi:hypothetical protein